MKSALLSKEMLSNDIEIYSLFKKAIWLYIVLLIFEGALRKWFLPSLATPLLLIRDPIVIWLVIEGWHRNWFTSPFCKAMVWVSVISFVLTLLFGHHDLFVALYGWRIYFFHFPMIFVIGKLLNRGDLLRMGQFILYVSIPMTILIVLQFNLPPTAWVNIGVGGEGTAGFGGVMGYMRPPGTFSFTAGYVEFQKVVGCFLFYYLISNKTLSSQYQLNKWLLLVILLCYLIAIPTSISRTNLFQTIVILGFLLAAALVKKIMRHRIWGFLLIGAIVLGALVSSGLLDTNIDVFTTRFEDASESEGGLDGTIGNRYLGGLLRAFENVNIPIFGFGLGLGTNAGAKLLGGNMFSFGFNGEVEWERLIGESGFLLGLAIIIIRLLFSVSLLKNAYKCLSNHYDLLPWILASVMLLTLPQGSWGVTTTLGFSVLIGGFTLAAVRTSHARR